MDYTTVKTDVDGRMLCPRCGAPLYARVVEVLSGVPVFLEEDDMGIRVEFNGDDATHSQCDAEAEYCEKCGWSSDTEPDPPVEDAVLQNFISALRAEWSQMCNLQSATGQRIHEPDMTTVALAVANLLDPEGFNVEPTQWCAITHPDVREDEEAHFIATRDFLAWPEITERIAEAAAFNLGFPWSCPTRLLPVPYGVVCCVGQSDNREDE
ncbi:MAG: hypothetical protein BWY63_00730 [Chloroflexi bacterium ADurb.Bin360]|nr:MAG: hypothetical protein BWY63_00730 [Chloroflexi bacterium ADurb.Bin360]